jgi:hypothetical protein
VEVDLPILVKVAEAHKVCGITKKI